MTEYIERESVIKAIDNEVSLDGLYANIQAIPAADVEEVKHGHWIAEMRGLYHGINLLDDKNFSGLNMYSCSECKEMVIYKGNYCPNCGAKMDAGDGKSGESDCNNKISIK